MDKYTLAIVEALKNVLPDTPIESIEREVSAAYGPLIARKIETEHELEGEPVSQEVQEDFQSLIYEFDDGVVVKLIDIQRFYELIMLQSSGLAAMHPNLGNAVVAVAMSSLMSSVPEYEEPIYQEDFIPKS